MIKQLGSVPMSDEILYTADIGLWSIEADSGKAPRMYLDETMRSILGIPQELTPEDVYRAWRENIDAKSQEHVTETCNKMIAGGHPKMQYTWHRPDNGIVMIIHSSGVRNTNYAQGMRFDGVGQDVTGVIRVQEEIERRIVSYESVLSAEYQVLCHIDLERGKLTFIHGTEFARKKLAVIDGYSVEEMFAYFYRSYVDACVVEEDRAKVKNTMNAENMITVLRTNNSMSVNFRASKNGEKPVYNEMRVLNANTGSEQLTAVVVAFKLSDADMRRTLELQEKLAEQNAFNRYFLSPYESAYYINLDTLNWQVYKRSEKLRQNYPIYENYVESLRRYINTEIQPDDRENASLMIDPERIRRLLKTQTSISFIFRKIDAEGNRLMQSEIVRGADDNHIALGFRDVTEDERRRAERAQEIDLANQQRHIKAFGEMINAALWSMDINGTDNLINVSWSDGFRHMFGFENTVDFPNTIDAWANRLHPDDKAPTLQDFYNGIKSRDTENFVYDIRYRVRRKNGEYCWYHALGRMENVDENIRRMFGIIIDISADVKLEEQHDLLQKQQKRLEEALRLAQSASRAKTTFLNNMSHDIRTPMNAIIGYTGLAASHINNSDQVQNYLSKITQSSEHLLSLINDVLDMSRIESGKMNLDEKQENLPDIVHTLRDIVQADIRAKQHDFFIDTVNVNDESIVCDKLRLNQVLLNILSNSIKYTANGGTISMRISQKAVKKNGYATYEFRIKDNGMGMSEEFVKTIFEPFTRVRSSTISGIQGTGLGMAITKNIIDMMGGKISIKSELGKGTETTVSFDFKLQEAPKKSVIIPELRGLRALIADDDTDTCLSVYAMLKEIGMRSQWCTSGKEAVVRADAAYREGDHFELYIIDWLMPDMNGIETTRRIRKVIGNDVPIIILTAYDWADVEEEAREAGVTGFVSKPMFLSDLHRVLNECLGKECIEDKPQTVDFDFTDKKILLVEDNDINREIATELLNEYGCTVATAEDGDIAVDLMTNAKTGDYDLVLMDVQMPRMDGYEATRRIRALGTEISKIPILAMTANAFEEDRKAALKAGMNEHIAKPINIDKLKETLARFL